MAIGCNTIETREAECMEEISQLVAVAKNLGGRTAAVAAAADKKSFATAVV